MVGILVTTAGIFLLVLGLVGASIEAYAGLLSALVQQQVSAVTQHLPGILRPEGSTGAEEAESTLGPTQILVSLLENLVNTPLWSILAVSGIVLIYSGLYLTHRRRLGR